MNAEASARGSDLLGGGRRIGIGPQWLARAWSGGINRVLDRIDSLTSTLPLVALVWLATRL